MFKRVERKRKRREEEEDLGLDEDTNELMGLSNTDSDESDSGSEQESTRLGSNESDLGVGEDRDQGEDAMSENEGVNEDPPISVEEALKDPIYLISLDPTVYGCVVCQGKLIKNAGMATTHRNAKVHTRRFEHFKLLAVDTNPRSNAWELLRAVQSPSSVQKVESQEPSKRALKRQAKQAAMREKRRHHRELKVKAIAKKAVKKLVIPSKATPESRNLPRTTRKKQKLESETFTSKTRDVEAKPASRTKTSSDRKGSVLKSRVKSTRKANNPS